MRRSLAATCSTIALLIGSIFAPLPTRAETFPTPRNDTIQLNGIVAVQSMRPSWLPRNSSFYAAAVRSSDGSVDVGKTLAAVNALGGSQYWYLLYPKSGGQMPGDWRTLPAFLSAADRTGIKVRVILAPPQTSATGAEPCMAGRLLPYQDDYIRWHRELGRLAKKHRSMIGTGIDDFITGMGCPSLRSGRSVARMTTTLRTYSGRQLDISPTIYLKDVVANLGGATRVNRTKLFCRYSKPSHVTFAHVDAYNRAAEMSFAKGVAALRAMCPSARVTVMIYAGGRDRPDLGFTITPAKTRMWTRQASDLSAPIVFYAYPLREVRLSTLAR